MMGYDRFDMADLHRCRDQIDPARRYLIAWYDQSGTSHPRVLTGEELLAHADQEAPAARAARLCSGFSSGSRLPSTREAGLNQSSGAGPMLNASGRRRKLVVS
jgi:hypothetical protein